MAKTTLEERHHRPVEYAPHASGRTDVTPVVYWRSEILQAMHWLREEGFGDRVEPALLQRFLGPDADIGLRYLDRLVEDGSIERVGRGYRLSTAGARQGALEFAASFEELTRPTPCRCGRDPWCDTSPDEAALLQ
jgi:hypothetical protein